MLIVRKTKIRDNNNAIKLSLPIAKVLEEQMVSEHLFFCPFHKSDKPHLNVTKDGRGCHCMSCGFHGSVITLLYQIHSLRNPQELYQLVNIQYGLKLPHTNLNDEVTDNMSFLEEIEERASNKRQLHASPPPMNDILLLHETVNKYLSNKISAEDMLIRFANIQRDLDIEYKESDNNISLDELMGGVIDWT